MDSYEWAVKLLDEHIEKPVNALKAFWYRPYGELRYSEDGETSRNPDDWEDAYSSDRVRMCEEAGGFVIMTVDNGCGDNYQIIFLKSNEVSEDD